MLRVSMSGGNAVRDSRLRQVQALLDDARCLLVDIVDERPAGADLKDFNNIDASCQFINSAIVYVQKAETHTPPDQPA
jgi:hypothetical protein